MVLYISNYIAHPRNQAKKEIQGKREENSNGLNSMQLSVLILNTSPGRVVA